MGHKLPSVHVQRLEQLEKEIEAKYDDTLERFMSGMLFPDATLVLDIDGTIRYCATSITKITGYEPNELVGDNVSKLQLIKDGHPLNLNNILAYVDLNKEHVFGTRKDVELVAKNGEKIQVFVLVSHLINGQELLFLIVVNKRQGK